MFAISMLKLSCGRQYRSDDLNGYAVCFGVAYGHSCPARLAVYDGQPGGTAMTCELAHRYNIPIMQIKPTQD